MVKSDEHMGKIKQKMTEEAVNKKAAAEARKQRDLKKFGKQVQVAKQQERDRQKRDMLGKIDLLKRSMWKTLVSSDDPILTDSKSARTRILAHRTRTSLTSLLKTQANQIKLIRMLEIQSETVVVAEDRLANGRRRTRNSASEARSALQRAETQSHLEILGASRRRR